MRPRKIGFPLRFIGPLTGHVVSQADTEAAIDMELLLIVKQKMTQFVGGGEFLSNR